MELVSYYSSGPQNFGTASRFLENLCISVRIYLNYTALYSKRLWSWYVVPQQPQIPPWFFILSLMLETKFYTHTIQHVKFYFVSFIPCITDNRFTSLNQQNAQTISLGTLYYVILNITKCFGPQGPIIRDWSQSNAA